jgi:hypothetical protein
MHQRNCTPLVNHNLQMSTRVQQQQHQATTQRVNAILIDHTLHAQPQSQFAAQVQMCV